MKDQIGQIENAVFIGVNEIELEDDDDLLEAEIALDAQKSRSTDLSEVFDLIDRNKKVAHHDQ